MAAVSDWFIVSVDQNKWNSIKTANEKNSCITNFNSVGSKNYQARFFMKVRLQSSDIMPQNV